MFRRLDPFGNPNVGVYVRATSKHLFVPPGLTPENIADLEAALGLEAITATVGGSPLLGSLVCANSTGCVIADFASDDEVAIFESAGLKTMRLRHARLNATGNNILCNDHGALVHPDLPDKLLASIAETLDVEAARATIARIPTVGTAALATNKGVIVHPLATDDELAFIKSRLHAPARIGTVNHGHGLVGAGMVANQNGAACGTRTTGIELGRIEEALNLLE